MYPFVGYSQRSLIIKHLLKRCCYKVVKGTLFYIRVLSYITCTLLFSYYSNF